MSSIPEDKEMANTETNDHHEHYNHLLVLPNRRIRTLSELLFKLFNYFILKTKFFFILEMKKLQQAKH